MSVNFRTRNQLLLARIQSAEGEEATPTPAEDAIRVLDPRFTPNLAMISTEAEVTASLSVPAPIPGGGYGGMTFGAFARGAGTAGAAPELGALLRACGFSETLTAADITGTAQAGGAGTITLELGASAIADLYKGMPIRITGGTGAGQVNLIKSYDGATKVATVVAAWETEPDATSQYAIDANALYRPITVAPEWVTLWAYQHHNNPAESSIRRRVRDAAAPFTLAIQPNQLARFDFTFRGVLPDKPDAVARPAEPVYPTVEPEAFRNARAFLGGAAVKSSDFSFDLGAAVDQHEDPAAELGFDSAQLLSRAPTGRIVPNRVSLASRDAFDDWKTATSRDLWLDWGSGPGRRISLYFPALRYTSHEETDVRGFAAEVLPFQATGLDDEIWLCFH
ncbi:MAG: hypothetical protein AB7P12_00720 [Alphaproteobacteria bacterium]